MGQINHQKKGHLNIQFTDAVKFCKENLKLDPAQLDLAAINGWKFSGPISMIPVRITASFES
jgi:hypothetical protein